MAALVTDEKVITQQWLLKSLWWTFLYVTHQASIVFMCKLFVLKCYQFSLMRDNDVFIWRCICFQYMFSDNTVCAFLSESQSANIRMNYLGKSVHSPCFIYTDPVNSAASEFGWSPDHYLSIHWAVSQSYLNKCPLVNLGLWSSSLVRSQTLQREISSAAVYGTAAALLELCSTDIPSHHRKPSVYNQKFNIKNEKRLLTWHIYGAMWYLWSHCLELYCSF